MKKSDNTKCGTDAVGVTVFVEKAVHTKVLLKQIQKFDKQKTIAEVCALAIEKGIDKV